MIPSRRSSHADRGSEASRANGGIATTIVVIVGYGMYLAWSIAGEHTPDSGDGAIAGDSRGAHPTRPV